MPNGKPGDHPLTDLLVHGLRTFSKEVDSLIREIARFLPPQEIDSLLDWFHPPPLDELTKILRAKRDALVRGAMERGWDPEAPIPGAAALLVLSSLGFSRAGAVPGERGTTYRFMNQSRRTGVNKVREMLPVRNEQPFNFQLTGKATQDFNPDYAGVDGNTYQNGALCSSLTQQEPFLERFSSPLAWLLWLRGVLSEKKCTLRPPVENSDRGRYRRS